MVAESQEPEISSGRDRHASKELQGISFPPREGIASAAVMPTKKISREQLRDALALTGMKQEELAEAARVSPAAIAEFERGERVLHERTFVAVIEALEARGVEFSDGGVKCGEHSHTSPQEGARGMNDLRHDFRFAKAAAAFFGTLSSSAGGGSRRPHALGGLATANFRILREVGSSWTDQIGATVQNCRRV